jgi:hypothetical protein
MMPVQRVGVPLGGPSCLSDFDLVRVADLDPVDDGETLSVELRVGGAALEILVRGRARDEFVRRGRVGLSVKRIREAFEARLHSDNDSILTLHLEDRSTITIAEVSPEHPLAAPDPSVGEFVDVATDRSFVIRVRTEERLGDVAIAWVVDPSVGDSVNSRSDSWQVGTTRSKVAVTSKSGSVKVNGGGAVRRASITDTKFTVAKASGRGSVSYQVNAMTPICVDGFARGGTDCDACLLGCA